MKWRIAHMISFSNLITAWSPWIISGDFKLFSNFRNIEIFWNSSVISTWWIRTTLNIFKFLVVINMEWSSIESLPVWILLRKGLSIWSVTDTSCQVRIDILDSLNKGDKLLYQQSTCLSHMRESFHHHLCICICWLIEWFLDRSSNETSKICHQSFFSNWSSTTWRHYQSKYLSTWLISLYW